MTSKEFAPNFAGAEVCPSPNFGPRRNGATPQFLILHYTGMASAELALERLCSPEAEVSAHYLVYEDGRILQLVPESQRAWHAGASFWAGERDINSHSIGIEIVNPGHEGGLPEFPEVQIASVISLAKSIVERNAILAAQVLAHSDIAPGRKLDPGEKFPWTELHANGIGHLVDPEPVEGGRFISLGERGQPVEALQAMFALYGYGLNVDGIFDQKTFDVVAAFQRHFRPAKVDGVADMSTITTLKNLLDSRADT